MKKHMREADEAALRREERELAREERAEQDETGTPEESAQAKQPQEIIPHVGHALDGSQYQDVVDEQLWAERPPTPEEQKRRQTKFDAPPAAAPKR